VQASSRSGVGGVGKAQEGLEKICKLQVLQGGLHWLHQCYWNCLELVESASPIGFGEKPLCIILLNRFWLVRYQICLFSLNWLVPYIFHTTHHGPTKNIFFFK
jgi:hypothetical protein